jgi:hypothetical protein
VNIPSARWLTRSSDLIPKFLASDGNRDVCPGGRETIRSYFIGRLQEDFGRGLHRGGAGKMVVLALLSKWGNLSRTSRRRLAPSPIGFRKHGGLPENWLWSGRQLRERQTFAFEAGLQRLNLLRGCASRWTDDHLLGSSGESALRTSD